MNADKIDFNYSHVSVLWCGKLVDGVEHDVVVEIAPDGMVTLVLCHWILKLTWFYY